MKHSTSVQSIMENGNSGLIINIETHLSNSLPNIVIVGFTNKSVDEAKERIRGALASSGIKLPKKRITINLAPADIPKEGSYFDLPILLSILMAGEIVHEKLWLKNVVVLGEVGLDGTVRPVRGIIGKILAAKKLGITSFFIPRANLTQARLIPNIKIYPVANVIDLLKILQSPADDNYIETKDGDIPKDEGSKDSLTLNDVVGQTMAKRALTIAAAGHHNIMLSGAPGTGKSMLAKGLLSIMPHMTREEMLEVTHIHSLANKNYETLVTTRPFRTPHHSASGTAIVGGGQNPKPGEISLSHNGVLLFDEFPEFSRTVIESLRQPIEERQITVSRAKDTVNYPAHFLLVGTTNPCPCGYYGTTKECSCLPKQILDYQRKISGPILDRIDLYIDVEEVDHSKIIGQKPPNAGHDYLALVEKARTTQKARLGKLNSELTNRDIESYAKLQSDAKDFLDTAAKPLNLSARAYIRCIKVARTIADIENSETITKEHISEALQYRKKPVSY